MGGKMNCLVEGCSSKVHAKGLCDRHYRQLRVNGRVLSRTIHDRNEIVIANGHAEITLYNLDKEPIAKALIDCEDVIKVNRHKWCYSKGYVSGKAGFLHRFLLKAPDGMDVDHINHNPLDNRKANLRLCTRSQNNMNSNKNRNKTSGVKGVTWNKQKRRWQARVWVDGTTIHLGFYDNLHDAAMARKFGEMKYYGEFAYQTNKTG